MSDNRRVYRTIRITLKQLFPTEPKGNFARNLSTLAAMVAGIVQGKSSQLPTMARPAPEGAKAESRVKKYRRWLQNERTGYEAYYLPFAQEILANLARTRPLVFMIDGSEVGQHCLTLMISLVYRKRAVPIVWLVVEGVKGHLPESLHLALLAQLQAALPETYQAIFLGDGEFDGVALQTAVQTLQWRYVCRTAKNVRLFEEEAFSFTDFLLCPGDCVGIPNTYVTAQAYGPVQVIAWWKPGCQAPLYLVTNFDLAEEAGYWYAKRFQIETFFSDVKSRGFNLHKSHLAEPERLARLMVAACLAYLWIVYLGVTAHHEQWGAIIHRTDRCDWSLFRLGLALLDHLLNEHLPIPVSFNFFKAKSVRC
ncbi:MAG: transposase [Nitrososphaera sp.]|nr:transposase [Nitrososphaera sp.]